MNYGINIFIFLNLFFKFNSISINYTIFTPSGNDTTLLEYNSIFGTGNKLKDMIYKTACISICNITSNAVESINENIFCCKGNNINELTCMDSVYCNKLKDHLLQYFLTLIILTYSSLLLITMISIFILFYYLSVKNSSSNISDPNINKLTKKQSLINGLVAAVLVLFTGLLFPIFILKIICIIKKKSITKILGGEFKIISSARLIISVEIKNSEKKRKYKNLEKENSDSKSGNRFNIDSQSENMDQVIDSSKKLKIIDSNPEKITDRRL